VTPPGAAGPALVEDEQVTSEPAAAPRRRRRAGRVLQDVVGGVIVLWGAATLTFLAVHLMPGNPAVAYAGGVGSLP